MEVRVEGLQRLHLRGAAHARGLDHPAAGAARDLLAVRRALVAVQLQDREPDPVRRLGDLVERRVDENTDQLGAAAQLGRDCSAASSAQTRGLPGQKTIPTAQAPSSTARWASAGSVSPQILTFVTRTMVARRYGSGNGSS